MPHVSSSRRAKRKVADSVLEPPKSPKVALLSPSLLLLEIPADANTSLPVWEAMRSQQLDVAWTVNPYSISVHLTPATSRQGSASASPAGESTSGAPQPRVLMQTIGQQQQSGSCVLLTFPQNGTQSLPPGQTETGSPNPSPGSSFIVSLPVIIAQPQPAPQPSTPTKRAVLPGIQTLAATRAKSRALSKVPVPSPFHTKNSSDIQICDRFLLGLCSAGKKCWMHHTPYPFHWQLWSVVVHQWIDISPRSQVLLERIYSDVTQEAVSIKDGQACYKLHFDSMELDDPSKYDTVRRLTNSDSLVRNPYFPSKWKIYWWNTFSWEEYNESVSACLLKKMSEKEPECSFSIGSQEYTVDFTTMTQTNVKTRFQREVRCRPVYRSLESMQPYLQTGIQTDPTKPASDPLPAPNFSVDPLEEFSSWYPPVWSQASDQDYSLVDVPAGTQSYWRVRNLFHETLSESRIDIVSIQQVQNLLHWDKYQRHKAYMQKQHTEPKEPLERHLFHGTTKQASDDICHNNFDPRIAGVNGASCGFGTYFATTASYSNRYSSTVGPNELRHMFLAKVLVGNVSLGRSDYRRPPPLHSNKSQHILYDTCVDNVENPTMFVVFDSCQCYPYYLIKYKDLPTEIDI